MPQKKQATGRQVVVSSGCQTGGITAALQVIFPNDEIVPLILPDSSNFKAKAEFIRKLETADVWVSSGGYELLSNMGGIGHLQLVRIPLINFSAFHPDIVYARRTSTDELTIPHYNSAIALWAYKNGQGVSGAERLFNKRTYIELGYLDHWGPSVEQLKKRFIDSDLNFLEFFLPMRREGLFMYSLNHPKAIALIRLAKLIALRLGAGSEVLDKHIDITDGLNEIIWPIYPEIGESLSLQASYEWKMGERRWIVGVRAFLEHEYKNYARQKISPHDISPIDLNEELYNHVLGAQAHRSKP